MSDFLVSNFKRCHKSIRMTTVNYIIIFQRDNDWYSRLPNFTPNICHEPKFFLLLLFRLKVVLKWHVCIQLYTRTTNYTECTSLRDSTEKIFSIKLRLIVRKWWSYGCKDQFICSCSETSTTTHSKRANHWVHNSLTSVWHMMIYWCSNWLSIIAPKCLRLLYDRFCIFISFVSFLFHSYAVRMGSVEIRRKMDFVSVEFNILPFSMQIQDEKFFWIFWHW